jgi:hypothetical protein
MASTMPVTCFISAQVKVKYTEPSYNVIIMTLRMFVVNFIEQFCIVVIPLFGVIFNEFYQVDLRGGGGISSMAHFSLTYWMAE